MHPLTIPIVLGAVALGGGVYLALKPKQPQIPPYGYGVPPAPRPGAIPAQGSDGWSQAEGQAAAAIAESSAKFLTSFTQSMADIFKDDEPDGAEVSGWWPTGTMNPALDPYPMPTLR